MGKVFCCGLPRTGTQSLTMTAKMMGLRTSHPRQGGILTYAEADFFADTPIWAQWRNLAEQFPDARFVLTVRDVEKWKGSFLRVLGTYARLLLQQKLPAARDGTTHHIDYESYLSVFGTYRNLDDKHLPEIWNDHVERVTDYFDGDVATNAAGVTCSRLLVIDITEGKNLQEFVDWMGTPLVSFPWVW